MRALIGIAAAGLVAVGLGFWLGSATHSATEISSIAAPTMMSQVSIWEIHNQAHLGFLPVQQIDDYSLVFTENEPTNSERR
jgi:PIN domain nuclease of toxin-antitoxin system